MDFSAIPLFSVMRTKLNYLAERQAVLAQNVANADTPGYKAQDIAEPDFAKMVSGQGGGSRNLQMTVTNALDITPANPTDGFKVEPRAATDELNPNGNNVDIEDEMSKIALNQADYQKVIGMYAKWITMFKTAIGNPSTGS